MTLKELLTSTALTVALAVPAFAENHAAEVETEVEAEAEMAASSDVDSMDLEGEAEAEAESMMAEGEADVEGAEDGDTMMAEGEAEVDAEAEDTMTVDADTLVPENELEVEGEDSMVAEAETDMEDPKFGEFAGMTVADIVGLDVTSADGEDVGEIDYLISSDNGYEAIIGIGGFLGLGEYTVALPLENFAMVDGELKLDEATEAELEAMPEIDESEIDALDGDYVIG